MVVIETDGQLSRIRDLTVHDRRAAGEVVTETFDYDGGRQVTAYIPPDPPEAVVFAGDGQLIFAMGRSPRGGRRTVHDDRRSTPPGR